MYMEGRKGDYFVYLLFPPYMYKLSLIIIIGAFSFYKRIFTGFSVLIPKLKLFRENRNEVTTTLAFSVLFYRLEWLKIFFNP